MIPFWIGAVRADVTRDEWWARVLLGVVSVGLLCSFSMACFAQDTIVSQRALQLGGRTLKYDVEAGFMPVILDSDAKAQIFYTEYRDADHGARRPVAFIWNGGPGSPSDWVQFKGFGPRIIQGSGFVDNPDTLLSAASLVFVDPVGTGFSRAASIGDSTAYYSTVGDAKATTQFIEKWIEQHRDERRSLFLVGESFGGYRAGAVAERLEAAGHRVAGVILLSGGAASGPLIPPLLRAALKVPQMTQGALALGRIAPDLAKHPVALSRNVTQWALLTYLPALTRIEELTAAERSAIAQDLSRFTGFPLDRINLKTLQISSQFLSVMSPVPGKRLQTLDMRRTRLPSLDPNEIKQYYQNLGFHTNLAYWTIDDPGPANLSPEKHWVWNYQWPQDAKWGSNYAEPWLEAAFKFNPMLKVFVATGQFDFLNSCVGEDVLKAMLEPTLASNYTMRCYHGGHMIYLDPAGKKNLSRDLANFIQITSKSAS